MVVVALCNQTLHQCVRTDMDVIGNSTDVGRHDLVETVYFMNFNDFLKPVSEFYVKTKFLWHLVHLAFRGDRRKNPD